MKTRNLNFLSNRRFAAVLAMVATALIAYAQETFVPTIGSVTQRTALIKARTNAEGTNVIGRGLQISEYVNGGDYAWETIDYAGGDELYTYRKEGLRVDTWYAVRSFVVPENGDTIFSGNELFSTKNIEIFTDSVVSISQTKAVLYGRISKGDDTANSWRYHVYKYNPGYGEGSDYIRGSYSLYEEFPIASTDTFVVVPLDGLENGTIFGAALSACNSKGERVMSHTYKYEDQRDFVKTMLDEGSSPIKSYTNDGWAYANTGEFLIANSSSDLTIKVNLPAPVVLCFDWEIKGEKKWFDKVTYMNLYVDDMKSSKRSITPEHVDEYTTEHITYHLDPGEHTILWTANEAKDMGAIIRNIKFGDDYQYFTTKEFLSNLRSGTTAVTATLSANVLQAEDCEVVEYGFEYRLRDGGGEFVAIPCEVNENQRISTKVTGLTPDTEYEYRGYVKTSDGKKHYTPIYVLSTFASYAHATVDPMQTSAMLTVEFEINGATVIGTGIEYGVSDNYGTLVENLSEEMLLTELNPGTEYYYRLYVDTEEGGRDYRTGTFTTKEITLTTLPVSNVSNRSATFNGTVECDTCSSAVIGFQWKTMTGWLSDPRFTEGVLTGGGNVTLGLTDGMLKADTDYQYRTAVKYKDKFYYSDWQTFRTELEFVAWPPTVGTMYRTDSDSNRIVLCGYIVPGSEAVTEYGYEYWRAETRTRAADVTRVVTGPDMVYTLDLTQLEAGDYCIRAYAKTASGTQYGETLTFSVDVMSGISSVGTSLPVCRAADGKLLIANAEGMRYYVADLSGRIVAAGTCASSTESVSLGDGIYVVRIDGGHVFKVMVR